MDELTPPLTVVMGNVQFFAVPLAQARFDEKGAIHIVFELDSEGVATVLDVGESSDSEPDPLNTPARRDAWLRQSKTQVIWVGTYMEPVEKLFSRARNAAEDRAQVVEKLRREYLAS